MARTYDLQETRAQRAFVLFFARGPRDVLPNASGYELLRLIDTLGMEVAGTGDVRRPQGKKSHVITAGVLEQLVQRILPLKDAFEEDDDDEDTDEWADEPLVEETAAADDGVLDDVDYVIVDATLSPRQQMILEEAFERPVLTRTAVILRIFQARAQTSAARMEVELARLRYALPRVRMDHKDDDRQGGGGRGERGHTNTELEKQRIRDRVAALTHELETLQSHEEGQRNRRDDVFVTALVGYTNAGKSTLMRTLTGADVFAEDKLFATLTTTVRQLVPATTPNVLVSDTVGFIQDLPHELVASFRSTLFEAKRASLLLLVVDSADPEADGQLRCVQETLTDINLADQPRLLVFNKIDKLSDEQLEERRAQYPDAVFVSAQTPNGLAPLHAAILEARDATLETAELLIPYAKSQLRNDLHSGSQILEEDYVQDGVRLTVRGPRAVIGRVRKALETRG